ALEALAQVAEGVRLGRIGEALLEQRQQVELLVGMVQRHGVREKARDRRRRGARAGIDAVDLEVHGQAAKRGKLAFDAAMEPELRLEGIFDCGGEVVEVHAPRLAPRSDNLMPRTLL